MLHVPLLAVSLAFQAHPVAEIDTIVRRGVETGVYPGAVVVVGTSDTVLLARGYGHFTWSSDSRVPSPDSTLYDIASLTKVVATTPAIMRLVDRGLVDLDAPVSTYVPDFEGEGKEVITVRHLLSHTSGLRAFLPLDKRAKTAEEARRIVVTQALSWRPGARVVYSDLNAMLMGWVVEGASGRSLEEFVREEIALPLGMRQTHYKVSRAQRPRAAPINSWRGHPIQGVVHDQNAERLDRVSGHAGLYSTGMDLARYAQMYLSEGKTLDGEVFIQASTLREFMARGRGNRALGWEMNDTTSTDNTGAALSSSAIGHGGYTGTSIWIDPAQDLFVILLTNRVFGPRTRRSITKLKAIRAALADASMRLHTRSCEVLSMAQVPATHCS